MRNKIRVILFLLVILLSLNFTYSRSCPVPYGSCCQGTACKYCGSGVCNPSSNCCPGGSCYNSDCCTPITQCSGRCGNVQRGCGLGTLPCGSCPSGFICGSNNYCVCPPNCNGKTCGPNGCGGSCGTCSTGTCTAGGCCPNCGARNCGMDPVCGTLACGTCTSPDTCGGSGTSGVCGCPATSCAGKCGSATNGCGTTCKSCNNELCINNNCVTCTLNSHCAPNECNTLTNNCCSGSTPYFNSTFEGGKCVMCNNDCQCDAGEKCVSNSCASETCDNTNTRRVLNNSACPTKSCVCTDAYPDWSAQLNRCLCNSSSCGVGESCVNGECASQCSDGTPVYTCANYNIIPIYCSLSGLTDNCTFCNGCGISGSCMTNGSCCNLLYPGDPLKKYWNGTTCTECNKSTHCDAGENCTAGECVECTLGYSCPTCPSAARYWNGSACAECIVGFVECVGGKVCSEGRCVEGCSDGTHTALPGECSNGKYCYTDGQFEPKCYINEAMGCACPSGTNCNEVTGNCDAIFVAATCSDGTINNTCSQSKPFFCNNLFFESSCMQCGCPDSYTCNIDGTCTMNPQVDEQSNTSLIFQNATEGDCVQGAMGWAKQNGKLVPSCHSLNCGCPISYTCNNATDRCVSLLNLQAPAAPVGVTCPNGQVLNEDFVCVDCDENTCGINMICSNGRCCPTYTPFWNNITNKCTCHQTIDNNCSSILPWRCNEDGSFLPNCEVCGCPPDYDCRESVCREKPGASLKRIQVPDINPLLSILTLFLFLFIKK